MSVLVAGVTDTADGNRAFAAPMLNLSEGGQNGFMTDPLHFVSSAPYVRQKLFAVLIAEPRAYEYLDGHNGITKEQYRAALKSLIELMPKSIDGLKSTTTWEFDGAVVGNSGEKLESVTKTAREVSTPTFIWDEKIGFAITKFWHEHGRLLQGDAELQVPGIVALGPYVDAKSPALTPDMVGFTVLFVEADNTLTSVVKAWLVSNMQPKTAGDWEGKREMAGSNDISEVNIEFTALTQIGKAVDIMAHNWLTKTLTIQNLRPLEQHAQGLPGGAGGLADTVEITDVTANLSADTMYGLAAEVKASVTKAA